jgi:hypothetical protein
MLGRAVTAHADVGRPRDREWVLGALAYLRAYVEELGREVMMPDEDKRQWLGALVREVQEAAEGLDLGRSLCLDSLPCSRRWLIFFRSDVVNAHHPAFAIKLREKEARVAGSEDGLYIDVAVKNALPCVRFASFYSHGIFDTACRRWLWMRLPLC